MKIYALKYLEVLNIIELNATRKFKVRICELLWQKEMLHE